jgi:predicted dehydrogenase
VQQLVQNLRSGSVETIEVPEPSPQAGEVLVRTAWSLISPGTEQAVSETASKNLLGKARDRPDQARQVIDKARREGIRPTLAAVRARLDDLLTPGYSSAGSVEQVGDGVQGLSMCDRVACVGANAAMHAEKVAIPASLCLPLPAGLENRWGAFAALGATAAHGVRVAGVEAGSVVAVIGLGLVGQLAAQLATTAGARVIGVDPDAGKAELALRLGAAGAASDPAEATVVVDALSGGHGADSVIITAATKDDGPIRLAATLARDRATISVVGVVGLTVPRRAFYDKELQLRVSRSYGPGRYDRAYEEEGRDYPIGFVRWTERRLIAYFLEEVAAGRIRLDDLVTHEFDIGDAKQAYAALESPGRLAILLRYPVAEKDTGPRWRAELAPPTPASAGSQRVGLIGPGLFARATLMPLLEQAGAELVAVAGTSPARAVGVARRWKAAYAASDAAELLDDGSVDVVVIATRHDSHARLAAQALERGKGVFLEKPLAMDQAGLESIAPHMEAGGRIVVDFNRSVAPATERVVDHFAGRADPLYAAVRVNAGFLPTDHWLRDGGEGGGRLIGEACHFVDLVGAIVGRPLRTVQLAPLGTGPTTLSRDSFVLSLVYEDGSVATVSYIASGHRGMPKERVEVIGAGKSAVIDDFRRVTLYPPMSRRPSFARSQDKGHATLLDRALRFFRDGGAAPIPYHRLIETTRATLLASELLSAGRPGAREI